MCTAGLRAVLGDAFLGHFIINSTSIVCGMVLFAVRTCKFFFFFYRTILTCVGQAAFYTPGSCIAVTRNMVESLAFKALSWEGGVRYDSIVTRPHIKNFSSLMLF